MENIFFDPNILSTCTLSPEESTHCSRVLRLSEGDNIIITDGKGSFFDAQITFAHPKHTQVLLINQHKVAKGWQGQIHVAFAPPKSIDRTEWFIEKATEIGIDSITLIKTKHSERKEIKIERLHKIMVAAMKQSQKAYLPTLKGMVPLQTFIKEIQSPYRFIAHCREDSSKKLLINKIKNTTGEICIMIGPEGDFSTDEINQAKQSDFVPVSLGESRLRSETAAIVACHTVHAAWLQQKNDL